MPIQKITCKQATAYITQQEEKRLSVKQRVELIAHLASCSLCRLFNRQNKWINRVLQAAEPAAAPKLADAEKEAIITAIAGPHAEE